MSNVDGSSDRYLPDAASSGHAHPEIEKQLAAYTASALPLVDRQRIMAHLKVCPACAQALAEVWRVRGLLRTLADVPTHPESAPSLADAVMARLAEAGEAREAGLGDDAPVDIWTSLEDEDVAIAPDQYVERPVLDEPGVLSPDFRPIPPPGYGRGRARDEWRLPSGGSAGENSPTDRHPSSGVDDRPVASVSARRRRDSTPEYPRLTRWSGYSAVAATAAIILLGALVLGVLGSHLRALGPGGAPAPGGTPTPTPAASQSALLPHSAVSSISMVSPTEGWAVGPVAPDGSNILLHYTGGHWVRARDVVPGVALSSVSMGSAQDGWAVGETKQNIGVGVPFHYTAGHWVRASDAFPNVNLSSISMRAADDGWAAGATLVTGQPTAVGTAQVTGQPTGVVLRYTGGHWIQVQTPISQFSAGKVQTLAANDVWIAVWLHRDQTGQLSQSALLHYHDGVWSVISSPAFISDFSMLSDDEGWAISPYSGIVHYQAGRWTIAATLTAGQLLALQMFSPNEGWAVGDANSCVSVDGVGPCYDPVRGTNTSPQGMFIMRYDGNSWTQVPGPAASGQTELSSIAIVSSGEVWAGGFEAPAPSKTPVAKATPSSASKTPVATGGDETPGAKATPSFNDINYTPVAILLHYSNGQWERVPVPVN